MEHSKAKDRLKTGQGAEALLVPHTHNALGFSNQNSNSNAGVGLRETQSMARAWHGVEHGTTSPLWDRLLEHKWNLIEHRANVPSFA